MSARTLDDTGTASSRLRTRGGDADPGDADAPEEVPVTVDEHCSIASAPIPGHGTE